MTLITVNTVARESIRTFFMNIPRVLYEKLKSFVNAVITPTYHNYIGRILNDSENVYRNCKIFNHISSSSTYLVKITKVFKQAVIHNIYVSIFTFFIFIRLNDYSYRV